MEGSDEETAHDKSAPIRTRDHKRYHESLGLRDLGQRKRTLAWLMCLRVSLGSVGRPFRNGCFLIFPLPINYGFELALVGSIIPIPASLDHSNRTTANGAVETSACDRQVPYAAISVGMFMAAFDDECIADKIGRHEVAILGRSHCIAGIFVQGLDSYSLLLSCEKLIGALDTALESRSLPYVSRKPCPTICGVCV